MTAERDFRSPHQKVEDYLDAQDEEREALAASRRDGLSLLLGAPKRALVSIEDDAAHSIASEVEDQERRW